MLKCLLFIFIQHSYHQNCCCNITLEMSGFLFVFSSWLSASYFDNAYNLALSYLAFRFLHV